MEAKEMTRIKRLIGLAFSITEDEFEIIPKDKLDVNQQYCGYCRNAREAIWNGNQFVYERYKWGSTFNETINHFEDDDGYDVFVPIIIKRNNE